MKAGLKTVPLGDVVEVIGGGTPSKRNPAFYRGDIPWATVRDMNVEHISKTEHAITPAGLKASSSKLIPAGEVVIATRVGLGKACILDQDTAINQDLRGLVPKPSKQIDRRFLYHWFKSIADQVIDAGTGATVQGVKLPFIKGLPFPLLSLEEQQRIVAVLDEAFEGLTRARAHAEANLQNARELFGTSLSAFISRHKKSWCSTFLGEAYDVRDGTHDSPKYHPTGRALITSKNLGRDGLHFEKVKYISEEDFNSIKKRSGVDKGDVLLAMIGTIGNPIVVDVEPDFAIKNVALFKMKEGRSGQFLRYLLLSKYVVEKMQAEAKGTTQQFVGLGYLRAFPIILPKPTEESAFVDELDRIETDCRSAEALYERKLQDLGYLRQSLLQKAFAGDLT